MRILQLVQQPIRRGAEMFAKDQERELRRQGHHCLTAYLYPSPAGGVLALPLNGDEVHLAGDRGALLERCAASPRTLLALSAAVRRFEPDVIQLNGGRTLKYGAALRRLHPRAPFVTVYRNIGDPRDWIRGAVKREAYRRLILNAVDGVVSLSERAAAVFRQVFQVAAPIQVIPNGIDTHALVPTVPRDELRRRLGVPKTASLALFVGSLTREKRVDRLLRIFARVTHPDARLWLVGGGPERHSLEAAIPPDLARRVSFIGPVEDVASYYAAADVFVLTSDTEGQPGALLEAAYFGLPVLATRVGFLDECVVHERTGLLFDRTDESGLSSALGELLADGALRQRFGQAASSAVSETYLLPQITARYCKFYAEVRSRRPESGGVA